ncbi:MAG: DMT family transporter, partial [Chitinophagaceae bacterium]
SDKDFHYWNGLIISMLSGLFSAIYSMMTEDLAHQENHIKIVTFQITTTFWVMLATLLLFYFAFPQLNIQYETLDKTQWIYLLIFSIGCTVLPMILSTWVMKKVSAFAVTLSVNIEPIYTICWAAYFFPKNEIMKYNFYIGAFVLVLSVIAYPYIKKYFDHSKIVRDSVIRVKYMKRKYTRH